MSYEIEKVWETKENYCAVIIVTDVGHRCGYVGIPERHILHGLGYHEHSYKLNASFDRIRDLIVDIDDIGIITLFCWDGKPKVDVLVHVHGGVTFSKGFEDNHPIESKDDIWWFGFDCAHSGDEPDPELTKSESLKEIRLKYPTFGIIRSLEFCIDECNKMSKQLKEIHCDHMFRRSLLKRKF